MRSMYFQRQKDFEIALRDEIIPFFKSLKMTLNRIAEGDKKLIDNIFDAMDFDVLALSRQLTAMMDR